MKKKLPGLFIVLLISALSIALGTYFLPFVEPLTIGIIIGILYTNLLGTKNTMTDGIVFAYKKILKWGIVLLGLKLNFNIIFQLGPKIILLILTLISFALFFSYFIGRHFKLSSRLAVLLGVGSSVCGASAIVAMGPVINADEDDITLSVATISLLGTFGVLIFSTLAHIISLSDLQYGIWAGSSLQGVAHAIAAAGARGNDSVSFEIGLIVKMARVALLAPLAIILGTIFNKNSTSKKVTFPNYVLYFLLLGIVMSINHKFNLFPTVLLGHDLISLLSSLGNFFILMSMTAMGLRVDFKTFEKKAIYAVITGSIVFISISSISYILVHFL